MGSFTFCLVRTAPINATIIINDRGSIPSAATPGWLDGVGRTCMLGRHHPHSFHGACFFITVEAAGTKQRVARVCWFFYLSHKIVVLGCWMGESGRSQALVCCIELLSETRQKSREERPPSEHGASGLAPAHSSILLSPAHYSAPHASPSAFPVQLCSILPQDICTSYC